MWFSKARRLNVSALQLCSLPPTSEAFKENVARAQLQTPIWLHALDSDPPVLDSTSYRWSLEEGTTELSPTTVPTDTSLAPTGLLTLIRCSCQGEMPCSTKKCSYNSTGMACTQLCACQGGHICKNESGRNFLHDQDED